VKPALEVIWKFGVVLIGYLFVSLVSSGNYQLASFLVARLSFMWIKGLIVFLKLEIGTFFWLKASGKISALGTKVTLNFRDFTLLTFVIVETFLRVERDVYSLFNYALLIFCFSKVAGKIIRTPTSGESGGVDIGAWLYIATSIIGVSRGDLFYLESSETMFDFDFWWLGVMIS